MKFPYINQAIPNTPTNVSMSKQVLANKGELLQAVNIRSPIAWIAKAITKKKPHPNNHLTMSLEQNLADYSCL